MNRYTIAFAPLRAPRLAHRPSRYQSRDLTFGICADGRILLAASTWDFVAAQTLGVAMLATYALTAAAHRRARRSVANIDGIYFEQHAAPGLRAEVFGGFDNDILRGRLFVGAAELPMTAIESIEPMSNPWRRISQVAHVMASQLFCEFHATQRAGLAERAGTQ